MADGIGFIHSVLAPVLTRIAREERPAWDQPRRKHDTTQGKSNANQAKEMVPEDEDNSDVTASPTHIDFRI